jgi:hypothetical protein
LHGNLGELLGAGAVLLTAFGYAAAAFLYRRWLADTPALGVTAPGPLAHVTGTCSRSNCRFWANVGVPWLRYVTSASWQAAHAFGRGTA